MVILQASLPWPRKKKGRSVRATRLSCRLRWLRGLDLAKEAPGGKSPWPYEKSKVFCSFRHSNLLNPAEANGPNRTLARRSNAAAQLSHSCRSCSVQHFDGLNDGSAVEAARCNCSKSRDQIPVETSTAISQQHNFPEAVIGYRLFCRTFPAHASDASHADKPDLRFLS